MDSDEMRFTPHDGRCSVGERGRCAQAPNRLVTKGPEIAESQRVRDATLGYRIAAGLEQLDRDIRSGHIHAIMEQHRNEEGDYLFVCA